MTDLTDAEERAFRPGARDRAQWLPTRRRFLGAAAATATLGDVKCAMSRPLQQYPRADFTELFGAPAQGRIVLDRSRYDLGDQSLSWTLSGVTVQGLAEGSTLVTRAPLLLNMLDCSDCVFQDINFVSTAADEAATMLMLVGTLHHVLRRIRFVRCTFYCPTSYGNALKF